jgi:ATP-dependent RNA helicase RhlE
MQFQDLQLNDALLRAIREQGYTHPTPIQQQAIPHVMQGRDLIGMAQTGTGKTAAFALPVLHNLSPVTGDRPIRVLVLAPTRELASQIGESFANYGQYTGFRETTIFGGVNQKQQVKALKRGVDIVTATPGRLLDLMNQRLVHFDQLDVLILDEADRMLDMGFLPDMRRIIKRLPKQRQTLMFSATMPPGIQKLAGEWLQNPVSVEVAPESTTVEAIEQRVYFVENRDKTRLLQHLIREHNMDRTLVFTRTKRGANNLVRKLDKAKIPSLAIHGNKSQSAREKALARFRDGEVQVLVATDIVARGIDVEDISHVVNYNMPNDTESYVHRIGRTGRAGATGMAFALCAEDEYDYLRNVERLIQMNIPVSEDHPFQPAGAPPAPTNLGGNRRHNAHNQKSDKPSSKSRRNRRRRNKK